MKLKTNSSEEHFDLWLGKAAPRYTSYPPAPFFGPTVNAHNYAKSLKGLDADIPVSLYIHIPFCRALCLYCGCNALVTHRAERVQGYLAALQREIKMVAALSGRRRIDSLHFGGGTPNTLGHQDLRDLFAALRSAFDFDGVREIAMELDPRVVGEDQAQILAECGVTRVSLGAQDFNPQVQEIVNRHQPYEMVAQVCQSMRAAGIKRINLDLMYGLPKQTVETMTDTALRVCELSPDRIALFSYAHVPQIKKHQKALEAHGLPDVHDCLKLDQTVRGILLDNGFQALGIDHFAKPQDNLMRASNEGRLHRNFQGYTEDAMENLIALGCSSISQTVDGYFQNEHDETAYQSVIATGKLPVRRGYLLTAEDRLRGEIIEQLMCNLSCDVAALCRKHRRSVKDFAPDFERLKPYIDAGIIACEDYTVRLTTPYRMAIRVISKAFDPHSQNTQQILSSRTA